jgi:hypothetical protein
VQLLINVVCCSTVINQVSTRQLHWLRVIYLGSASRTVNFFIKTLDLEIFIKLIAMVRRLVNLKVTNEVIAKSCV